MRIVSSDRHSTALRALSGFGLRRAKVCSFDGHLDTAARPSAFCRAISSKTLSSKLIDSAFNAGSVTRPVNSTNFWSAACARDQVSELVWVCPRARDDAWAKQGLVKALARQRVWPPDKLVDFLESSERKINLEGFEIEALSPRSERLAQTLAEVQVLDIDLDFFYDPESDGIERGSLRSLRIAENAYSGNAVMIAFSTIDGYCPARLSQAVVKLRGIRESKFLPALSRSLVRLAEKTPPLAAPYEVPRLMLRYPSSQRLKNRFDMTPKRASHVFSLALAAQQLATANYSKAMTIYFKLSKAAPKDWRVHYLLARCALQLDDLKGLRYAYDFAKAYAQYSPELAYVCSAFLLRSGDISAGLEMGFHSSSLAPSWIAPLKLMRLTLATARRQAAAKQVELRMSKIAHLAARLIDVGTAFKAL